MKKLIIIFLIIWLIWLAVGIYLLQNLHPKAPLIMGSGVCFLAFVLMPLFIYDRYSKGKYKKYQLKDENLFHFKNDKK